MSMFVNFLAKASDFFLLLFPFSWNYAGILSSSVSETYGAPLSIPKQNKTVSKTKKQNKNKNLLPGGGVFI